MRRLIAPLTAALTLLASAVAAQTDHRFSLFAGLEPGASYSQRAGWDLQTGYVLGLDTYVAPRWAVEVAGSFQSEAFSAGATGLTIDTSSLDAAGRFDLLRRGRWTVHALGGIRYSERRDEHAQFDIEGNPVTERFTAERTGVLLGLGADLAISRRFSLRFSAKQVPWTLNGDDRLFADSALGTALAIEF